MTLSMLAAISIAILYTFAACGGDSDDGRTTMTIDANEPSTPGDSGTSSPADASAPPIDSASGPPDATVDARSEPYGVGGCWVTHTDTGDTQLDLVEASDGSVTGTQTYMDEVFTLEDGQVDDSGLAFRVHWVSDTFDFYCDYTFTEVSTDALSGTADCGDTAPAITADRTCPQQ